MLFVDRRLIGGIDNKKLIIANYALSIYPFFMPKPYTPNDAWSQRASAEGFRARSVYKLQELDEKFRLLHKGMTVLDVGAAPGSWLQYVSQRIGPMGRAIGIDLQDIEPIADNVSLYTQDCSDHEAMRRILHEERVDTLDLILSDLAPRTSGIRDIDQWRSIELSHMVLAIARDWLKPSGYCVMKVLRGADFDEWYRALKMQWSFVKNVSVKASRDRSTEVYVLVRR